MQEHNAKQNPLPSGRRSINQAELLDGIVLILRPCLPDDIAHTYAEQIMKLFRDFLVSHREPEKLSEIQELEADIERLKGAP